MDASVEEDVDGWNDYRTTCLLSNKCKFQISKAMVPNCESRPPKNFWGRLLFYKQGKYACRIFLNSFLVTFQYKRLFNM